MKWLRHRKARRDRDAGMVFAWRIPVLHFGRMVGSVLVVGLVAAFFVSMVRVRVGSPPVRSQRRGTVVLEPGAGAGWFERLCAERTPFPAPFDAWGFDDALGVLAKHPAWSATERGGYVPEFREIPTVDDLVPKHELGSVRPDLPPLPPMEPVPDVGDESGFVRRVPVLRADSPELAARIPVPVPGFGGGEPPPGEHRFLIEVDASGRVLSAEPLTPSPEGGTMGEIARWLLGVHFEPGGTGRQWYVVTATFVFSSDHD